MSFSFMHWLTWVKPPLGFEPRSPVWEVDDLPTKLSLPLIIVYNIVNIINFLLSSFFQRSSYVILVTLLYFEYSCLTNLICFYQILSVFFFIILLSFMYSHGKFFLVLVIFERIYVSIYVWSFVLHCCTCIHLEIFPWILKILILSCPDQVFCRYIFFLAFSCFPAVFNNTK